jgi:ATP phosphoribosyltransferase regulatory subunit
LGYDLFSGGRYNNLLARFGSDLPATGFALGVDRVLLVMERQNSANLTKQHVFRFHSLGGWNARRIQWIMERREEGLQIEILNAPQVNPEELHDVLAFLDDERIVWYGKKGREEFDPDGAVLFMTLHSLDS